MPDEGPGLLPPKEPGKGVSPVAEDMSKIWRKGR